MGKARRIKQDNAAMRKKAEEEARKKAFKRKKQHKIIALCFVIIAVIIMASVGSVIGVGAYNNSGAKLRNTVGVSSENYQVNNAMVTYFFTETYNSYVDSYSSYLSYMGLDTSSSLKTQDYSDGVTWFDYFMEQTTSQINELVLFAEGAKANGMELTDEELENIKANADEIDTADYGKGIKTSDIENCLELSAIAYKYYNSVYSAYSATDGEVQEYYDANSKEFSLIDYLTYSFDYDEDNTVLIHSYTDRLAAATTAGEFTSVLSDYLENVEEYTNDTELSDELDSAVNSKSEYSEGDEFSEWAFGSGRTAGETYTEDDGDGTCAIFLLTAVPYADQSPTVDVRHILLTADTYGSDSSAKSAADSLLAEWQSGDADEESFGSLAALYSEDSSSSSSGGLYEGVYEGQMVDSFNDWCFDASRQAGDTAVVESDYGYHVMYFSGGGDPAWKSDVKDQLWNEEYESIYNQLAATYTVSVNSENTNKIEA